MPCASVHAVCAYVLMCDSSFLCVQEHRCIQEGCVCHCDSVCTLCVCLLVDPCVLFCVCSLQPGVWNTEPRLSADDDDG